MAKPDFTAALERLAPLRDRYRSYPRIHRVLIASSAFVSLAVAAMLVVFAVLWINGGLSPALTSESARQVIVAERSLKSAEDAARAAGVEPENYPAAVSAEANLVVALSDAGHHERAIGAAESLATHADGNPRALYAVAYVFGRSSDDGYTSQVLDLYAAAAEAVKSDRDELTRAIYLGYGRALAVEGDLELAQSYLTRAAALPPAAAQIYLEVAEIAEARADWFGAAFAYAAAQAYDPLMVAAQEGFDRIAEAHPADARAALESPSMPEGSGDGHP